MRQVPVTNVRDFARFKQDRRKISIVTAYDSWSAHLVERSNVDAILIGDSAAMVMHGHRTTVPATVAMMALHTAAVARAVLCTWSEPRNDEGEAHAQRRDRKSVV